MSKTLSTASLTVSFSLLPVSSVSALAASSAFFVSGRPLPGAGACGQLTLRDHCKMQVCTVTAGKITLSDDDAVWRSGRTCHVRQQALQQPMTACMEA